jgi:hypothetical protein
VSDPEDNTYDDSEFRKQRTRSTFKAVLFGGIATASFFGVMGKLVDLGVKAVKDAGALETLTDVPSLLIMGGVMAVGAVFTFLAQHEWTNTKILEDDHLARKNAQCMGHEVSHSHQVENPTLQHGQAQNNDHHHQRADGKKWAQVVSDQQQHHQQSIAIH